MTQKAITVIGNDELKAELAKLGKDAPEAVRIATTLLGERAQREMRQKLPTRFTFRGTAEAFSRAIIFQAPRATAKRKMTAVLKVGSDTGGTKATATRNLGVLLARHEEPDSRTETGQVFFDGRGRPMTGLGFFLPANGLRTNNANPSRKYYPSSIGASLRRTPDNRVILAKGTKKGSKSRGTGESFFATRIGIFRRRHTSFGGRAQVEALWWFKRTIRTPARLALWETAESVFERFAIAMTFDAIDTVLERTSPQGLR
jgi:hypothetical protein